MTPSSRSAASKAQEWLARQPIFLDTETTGLDRRDQVVDICLVDHDGSILFDSLVRPTVRVPLEASRIHGITNEMVAGAPSWTEIWPEIEPLLSTRPTGIYNLDFDVKMVHQTHQAHGIPWRFNPSQAFCIMKLYAEYRGEWNHRFGNYRWHKLEEAGRQCRIPLPNSHRAKDDALLARAVLLHMAAA